MKRFASLALIFAFALTSVAHAKDNGKKEAKQRARHNGAAARGTAQRGPVAGVQQERRSFSNGAQQFRQQRRLHGDVSVRPRADRSLSPRIAAIEPGGPVISQNVAPAIASPRVQQAEMGAGVRSDIGRADRNRFNGIRGDRNRLNRGDANNNWAGNTNGQGNWRNGDNSGGDHDWQNRNGNDNENRWDRNRSGNRRNWDRTHRNRSWWRSHYTRFALFGGGYYYWNGGSWYPAYGYDPYFTNYSYDAPIDSYDNLEPGQVVANVQVALQRRGYNPGGVDGQYGPATRRALLDYQRDNGLPTTGEIDEATLDSLELQ